MLTTVPTEELVQLAGTTEREYLFEQHRGEREREVTVHDRYTTAVNYGLDKLRFPARLPAVEPGAGPRRARRRGADPRGRRAVTDGELRTPRRRQAGVRLCVANPVSRVYE